MTASDTPGVDQLDELVLKVTGQPGTIRQWATSFTTLAHEIDTETGKLDGAVTEVLGAWQGESARAFAFHMQGYSNAGSGFRNAMEGCAVALNTVATDLETAESKVRRIRENLITQAGEHRRSWARENPDNPEGVHDGLNKLGKKAVSDAEAVVSKVNTKLSDAATDLKEALGLQKVTYKSIEDPTTSEFVPGNGHKMEWLRIDPKSRSTDLAGAPPMGGGGGGGGYTPGPSSSGGTVPQPKEKIVEWIKAAIREITRPERAAEMKRRGIDVSDLSPDDPKDIERIWTVIFHESGGNPNAINNWDINAQNGVPSQGLMQTIPPTFDTHSLKANEDHNLPGFTRIREPVDNIIAGVLYTYDRYGNLANHPGIHSLERGGPYRPY